MATIVPAQWCDPRPRREAERRVYHILAEQLTDDFTVIHDMAWISTHATRTPYIQADFVICHPSFGAIVVEVKGGMLFRRDKVWYQQSHTGEEYSCRIPPQQQAQEAAFQLYELMQRLSANRFPLHTIVSAVCFPDCIVTASQLDASLDRALIIDYHDLNDVVSALERVRDYWHTRGAIFRYQTSFDPQWIRFLRESLVRDIDLRPLLGPLLAVEKQHIQHLSDEQVTLFFAMQTQRRIAVPGCAGSGKTLLAQVAARRFAQQGKQVLLCCYNRPLRDHLAQMLADMPDVHVMTFMRLCYDIGVKLHPPLDLRELTRADVTATLLPALQSDTYRAWRHYDVVIIDEGQDFAACWWDVIECILAPPKQATPLFIFYDDNQRVYQHKPRLPDGVQELPLTTNFRTTQAIHHEIIPFYRGSTLPLAVGPQGDSPVFIAFDGSSEDAQWQELRTVIRHLTQQGVAAEDIVVLTPRGRTESALVTLADGLGLVPQPAPGKIQWDTIYRFKGLEQAVVIVVELTATTVTRETLAQLLYVAYSRACHRLYVLHDVHVPEAHVRAKTPRTQPGVAALLDHLNEQQRAAVQAPLGPTLVWAGAGTGKTRVLTQRIAYLLDAHQVAPEQIVAVTFTNKATREMRQRLAAQLDRAIVDRLSIKTIHGLCYDILRREIVGLEGALFYGRTSAFQIVNEREMRRYCGRAKVAPLTEETVRHYIIRQKQAGYLPVECPSGDDDEDQEIVDRRRQSYTNYDYLLRHDNRLDFHDLILLTARLLQEHPMIASRLHRKWLHLLVDEFQDTDALQFTILRQLYEGTTAPDDGFERSLFVVGDAQQSIYRWRGADYTLFLHLKDYFPTLHEYTLTENYRSTPQVLATARAIAKPEYTGVSPLPLEPHDPAAGPAVAIIAQEAVRDEAILLAQRISATIESGVDPNDIAILMRVVRHQRAATITVKALEDAFRTYRIPYVLVDIQSFYRGSVVTAFVAFLRVLVDPYDDANLRALLTSRLAYGINDGIVDALASARQQRGLASIWDLLYGDDTRLITGGQDTHLRSYSQLKIRQVGQSRYTTIERLLRSVLRLRPRLHEVADVRTLLMDIRIEVGFDTIFAKEREQPDYESVISVFASMLTEGIHQGETLPALLNQFMLDDEPAVTDAATGKVHIMSIHKSKGLEFHTVALPAFEEGVLPSNRAEDAEEVFEEGRICYVALTRARRELIISTVQYRGSRQIQVPSRYVDAIQRSLSPRDHEDMGMDAVGEELTTWSIFDSPEELIREAVPVFPHAVADLRIDLAADAAAYAVQPATIVIDTLHTLPEPHAWTVLEYLLHLLEGAYPLMLLVLDEAEQIQCVDTGLSICGAPAALTLIEQATGFICRREPETQRR